MLRSLFKLSGTDYQMWSNEGADIPKGPLNPMDDNLQVSPKAWKRRRLLPKKKIYQLGLEYPMTNPIDPLSNTH